MSTWTFMSYRKHVWHTTVPDISQNKLKNKKYHTVVTISQSIRKFVKRGKFDTITHIIDDFHGLVQSPQ